MDSFTRIVIAFFTTVIPVLGFVALVVTKRWMRFQERKLEIDAKLASERMAMEERNSSRLEHRVAVLERILTDRSTLLGDEIDRLRDAPLN